MKQQEPAILNAINSAKVKICLKIAFVVITF